MTLKIKFCHISTAIFGLLSSFMQKSGLQSEMFFFIKLRCHGEKLTIGQIMGIWIWIFFSSISKFIIIQLCSITRTIGKCYTPGTFFSYRWSITKEDCDVQSFLQPLPNIYINIIDLEKTIRQYCWANSGLYSLAYLCCCCTFED